MAYGSMWGEGLYPEEIQRMQWERERQIREIEAKQIAEQMRVQAAMYGGVVMRTQDMAPTAYEPQCSTIPKGCGHKPTPPKLVEYTKGLLAYHLQAHPEDANNLEAKKLCCVKEYIKNKHV